MIGSLALAAALLLGAAGLAKLVAPAPAATMLRRAWPTVRRPVLAVRATAVVEVATALAVLADGGRWSAVALGCCYLAFTALTARLVATRERASCGCFGGAESPVGAAHLVLNIVCTGLATTAVLRPAGPLGGLPDVGALRAAVGLGQAVLLAYLGFLSITALPALNAARRRFLEAR